MSPFVRPLPLEIPLKYREIANAINAYSICLSLEQKLNGDEDVERNKQNLVYCRVLGYLIQYAPREEVVTSVAADIVSCENDQDIFHLGKMFCYDFIAPCTFIPYVYPSLSPTRFFQSNFTGNLNRLTLQTISLTHLYERRPG